MHEMPRNEQAAPNNLFLVFSEGPASVPADDFEAFYARQAQTNIDVPGFVSAQRYVAQEVVDRVRTGTEQHLALYEYEAGVDMSEWQAIHAERFGSGAWPLPEWFSQVRFTTWNCVPRNGRLLSR